MFFAVLPDLPGQGELDFYELGFTVRQPEKLTSITDFPTGLFESLSDFSFHMSLGPIPGSDEAVSLRRQSHVSVRCASSSRRLQESPRHLKQCDTRCASLRLRPRCEARGSWNQGQVRAAILAGSGPRHSEAFGAKTRLRSAQLGRMAEFSPHHATKRAVSLPLQKHRPDRTYSQECRSVLIPLSDETAR